MPEHCTQHPPSQPFPAPSERMTDSQTREVTQLASPVGQMAGEYRLLRKLGEGGCGAVYAAEHPLLKRRAAVKVLHRAPSVGSSGLARFIAEAQVVNQIQSHHIVDVFSFGELDDGRPFYVMDLLEGEPLDRYLARLGRLDVAAVLQILRPLCQALDLAHAAGIVHRDVKPQNIFLARERGGETVPKLLDFGIAKLTHDVGALTVSGAVLGTPLYMSPEQARGTEVDARTDVYALGVLVYELLTGRVPLQADSALGLAMAHLTLTPSRPSSLHGALPEQLDAPILRMLAKDRDERPASAGEALSALADAAQRAGIEVPTTLRDLPSPALVSPTRPVLATTVGEAEAGSSAVLPVARPLASLRPRDQKRALVRLAAVVAALCALSLLAYVWQQTRALQTPSAVQGAAAPALHIPALHTPALDTPAPVAAQPSTPPRPESELQEPAPSVPTAPPLSEPARPRKRKPRIAPPVPRDLENPF